MSLHAATATACEASGNVIALRAYTPSLTRTADKSQRKLDMPLRRLVRDAIMSICASPQTLGERLSQPFSRVYSHHVKYKGKEFRIAYQICEASEQVIILLIGPHENFYRNLKNMLYAS